MNLLLWSLQGILAVHTAIGAIWKLSNSSESVGSLSAIPQGIWTGLSVIEIICSVCLVIPLFNRKLGFLAPYAAVVIVLEMLLFCGIHLASGASSYTEIIYWLVVAFISGFLAYGRLQLKPIQ